VVSEKQKKTHHQQNPTPQKTEKNKKKRKKNKQNKQTNKNKHTTHTRTTTTKGKAEEEGGGLYFLGCIYASLSLLSFPPLWGEGG